MRGRFVLALAAAAVMLPSLASAQRVGPSAAASVGSAQRRAILNALRPAVERELRGPVEFVINCIQVQGGMALVNANPQRPGGGRINPNILGDPEFRDGLTVTAVMRFRGGRWSRVDHAIGATDVWYEGMVTRALQASDCG